MPRGTRDWGLVAGGQQAVAELDTYITRVSGIVAGNNVAYIVGLFNPANSGVVATITRVHLMHGSDNGNGLQDTNAILYRTTAAGTGTARTPNPLDTNSPAATLQGTVGFTVSPTTSLILASLRLTKVNNDTANISRADGGNDELDLYRYLPGSLETPLRLRAGQGIAVEINCMGTIGSVLSVHVVHTEEPA